MSVVKKLRLCNLVLLGVCCARPVWGQALTLDQLIALRGKRIIDVDEYLVSRNWRFVSADNLNDSTTMSFWVFDDAHKRRLAELTYRQTLNRLPVVIYSTPNRLYFSGIKEKITAYHMEYMSQWNMKTAAWTAFRGANYDALLSVRPMIEEGYRTWYTVQVQRHGMVKLYYKDEKDGETKNFWFDEQEYYKLTAEQLERERAKADSARTVH
jgi:hypothetical protein